jgi:protease-4
MKLRFPVLAASLLAAALPVAAQKAKEAAAAAAPAKAERIVKLIAPSGAYADLAEQSFSPADLLLGGGAKPKPFYELVEKIEALAKDDATEHILFDLSRGFGMNMPQLVEIDRCMAKLRKAGKKCWAYLENAGNSELRIAARCDKVLMADMGMVDFSSPALSITYLRDALEFLGIQMDVLRCGDFKGAAEPYMLSRMSPHLRALYEEMLARMNDDVVARIAQARNLQRERVRELQKQRLFTASAALEAGLVDKLVPWEGGRAALVSALGTEEFELQDVLKKERKSLNFMTLMTEMFAPKKGKEIDEESIVVLHLAGPIVDGDKAQPATMVSGPTVKTIRELAKNDKVKAVVARVNSPGGSATASEAIRRAMLELAEKKPVVYSMGRVAGSGGYWITCVGKPILVEAGTITGSIGVLGVKPNMGPLMRRFGVHEELVALDESAGMMSTSRGWTDAEKERFQGFMNEVYERFIAQAAASRKMSKDAIAAIAGGRVFSGEQAVANGLVDKVGGLEDAIAMIAKDAGLSEGYKVIHEPKPKDPMDMIVEQLMEADMQLGALANVPAELRALLRVVPGLEMPLAMLRESLTASRPMVWAVMPFELRVQ